MRSLMICLILLLSQRSFAVVDPAAQLATAKDAVDTFLTNNAALLLNVKVGDRATTRSSYYKTFITAVGDNVVKTKCTRTTTENHTVLYVGTDVTSSYYYDYVKTTVTGTCPIDQVAPVIRMKRLQLPSSGDDVTSDWAAGMASNAIVMGMWNVADFGDGESGIEMIKLNFVKSLLTVEAARLKAFTKTGTSYAYIGQDSTTTTPAGSLALEKVVALANSLSYIKFCDDSDNCTDGQAVAMGADGLSFNLSNGSAPSSVTYTVPTCSKGAKSLYGSCNYTSSGLCFEYYGTGSDWSAVDTNCTGGGGTWSTTKQCPGYANLDAYSTDYPELNPVTKAAACTALCTTTTATIAFTYATTAVSTFRKAAQADAKLQCKNNLGTHKAL